MTTLDQQVRMDLRRHDFKERERLLVETVLDFSLARGRAHAVIPRLDDFAGLTGISRGNVSDCLEALTAMGVVAIDGQTYRVLPQSAIHVWRVRPRVNLEHAATLQAELEALNTTSQGDLLPAVESADEIRSVMAVAMASGRDRPPGGPKITTARPEVEALPVPNSGTNLGAGHCPVPDSGTPFKTSSLEVKPLQSFKSFKRQSGGIPKSRLPEITEDELHHVPRFRDNLHFQGWCQALEAKHGGWMGVGSEETWSESFGRLWWRKWQQDPTRFQSVWNEALSKMRENKITDSIGGCAYELWINERIGVSQRA